jgi:flavin reductase (DIM6/NTAB) family NADH-FMN oxidoreductase RutF
MNETSAGVAPEIDEFELAHLSTAPSLKVKPPRVAASPVAFECRLTQQFALKDADGNDTPAVMTFGEVVMVHIDEALLKDGVYQTLLGKPVLRGGGPGDYFTISEAAKFVMLRPK